MTTLAKSSLAPLLNAEGLIQCPKVAIQRDWIDYNGHLNMAYYNVVFDRAMDTVFDGLGIGADYVNEGGSCFTVEVHVTYQQEVKLGDDLQVDFHLLDWDAKRLHSFERMYHAEEGYLAATSEQMTVHVDMTTRRSAPFPQHIQELIEELSQRQQGLSRPEQAGRAIGIKRRG